jgi:hypothetical protein
MNLDVLGRSSSGSPHVVLLGDSVFDNARYSAPEPDVASNLRDELRSRGSEEARVSLLAVDGARTDGVRSQLFEVPRDATHLVLSSGGNDALGCQHLLDEGAGTVADALLRFVEPVSSFRSKYRAILDLLAEAGLPTWVCTTYEGDLGIGEVARVAVALFNDVIYRSANRLDIPVIELRSVCREAADYVNAIEPSGQGGRKIARAVADAIHHPLRRPSA